ncbi:hypothetical protein V6N13_148412 [Hibiscus sabdariffa]
MSHENPNYLSIDIPASGLSEPLFDAEDGMSINEEGMMKNEMVTMRLPDGPKNNEMSYALTVKGDEAKNEVVKTILEDDEIYLANDDVIVS